VPSYLPDE
jgi:hypothetical protein